MGRLANNDDLHTAAVAASMTDLKANHFVGPHLIFNHIYRVYMVEILFLTIYLNFFIATIMKAPIYVVLV
jgi:hypothetical protein